MLITLHCSSLFTARSPHTLYPKDHLVATGAEDGSVRIWDMRKMTGKSSSSDKASASASPAGCVATFRVHSGAIIRLEWHPTERVRLLP